MHTWTSKCTASKWFSGENETGEYLLHRWKANESRSTLLTCPLSILGWDTYSLYFNPPIFRDNTHTHKVLNTKYQDHSSRLCLEGKLPRNPRLEEKRDSWEVESIKAACEGLEFFLFALQPDNRTKIDQRASHWKSQKFLPRNRSIEFTSQIYRLNDLIWH